MGIAQFKDNMDYKSDIVDTTIMDKTQGRPKQDGETT